MNNPNAYSEEGYLKYSSMLSNALSGLWSSGTDVDTIESMIRDNLSDALEVEDIEVIITT